MQQRIVMALTLALGTLVACDGERSVAPAQAREAELDAEQVVARHLAALGGVDRLKSVKTLVVRGEYREGEQVDTYVAYRARPNKFRKEGTHKGKAFVKLFDGARGYKAEGGEALAAAPDDVQKKMRSWSEFDDPLVDHAARGHKVALAGTEDVRGARAYHLELTLASGDVEHRYLDATTFLPVKYQSTFKDKDGVQRTRVVYPSDWRDVSGVKYSFASEGEIDGVETRTAVTELQVDVAIDPAKFSAPAADQVALAR